MFFLLFREEQGLVLIRLVELLMFEFDVLEEGSVRPVTSRTFYNRTNKIPFNLVCSPPVSFFTIVVVLDRGKGYFYLFEALVEDIFFRVDEFELVGEDVVLADEADVGLVELVESGVILEFEGVHGQGEGAGDQRSHVYLILIVSEALR